MRARVSIPAWAKLLAISVATVSIAALFVAAPWRQSRGELCRQLLDNVELVRAGDADARMSDTFSINTSGRGMPRVRAERGDFSGEWTVEQVRSCLGAPWSEIHATATASRHGDAWTFVRSGWPNVLYVQSRTDEYAVVQRRVMIERTPSPPVSR